MSIYLSAQEAVADMQERGFTEDFQLFANDLLWVQEKSFVRMGSFAIVEYHKIYPNSTNPRGMAIFGIVSLSDKIKGILLHNANSTTTTIAPIIYKKLNELNDRVTHWYHI